MPVMVVSGAEILIAINAVLFGNPHLMVNDAVKAPIGKNRPNQLTSCTAPTPQTRAGVLAEGGGTPCRVRDVVTIPDFVVSAGLPEDELY
jgi:hypothetical protein